MSVTVVNIDIDAGTDFYLDTTYTDYTTNLPKDLTGYSALIELRSTYNDPRVFLRLSTDNGRILLGGAEGTIIARFLPEDTNPIKQSFPWTRAVYDLVVIDPNGIRVKLLKGFVNVVGTCSYDPSVKVFLTPISLTSATGGIA